MPPLRLSVLDQSPIPEGATAGDALRNTLDLARAADGLGYARYWLAEHHSTPGLACASPEAMIGPVAAATTNLRVGSGGIMLPHYSPLKVAETFSMLSGLFPGRIDLGIGRAPGSSAAVARALQRDRRLPAPDDFPDQLTELLGYFEAPATRFASPEVWLLGSSPQSAVWAAESGLPYAFADFINPEGAALAASYRDNFRPSHLSRNPIGKSELAAEPVAAGSPPVSGVKEGRSGPVPLLQQPKVAVCVWAICAGTEEEALRLSLSARMMMLLLFRGALIPVPPVEKAEEFLAKEGVAPQSLPMRRRIIAGDPRQVRAALEAVAAEYGAGEVFVVNILYDHAARLRSYELIAAAFHLAEKHHER
jgi:alkanesulfonate monooxygenase SsuD/methylene tetrahydromethanopterin reductase-like flavin-dependent oxidoreductase (luciferase family)